MENNPFSLKEKNIIITGASSGIGRQCAVSCSQMGARIIIIGRNQEKLQQTFSMLSPGNHILFRHDVTDYENTESVISQAVEKIGPVNGFIHCVGLELTLPVNMMKPKHYEDLFATNVISGFEFAKHLSKKKYLNADGASFIFISSVMGILGEIAHTGYCLSKGALVPAVKALALELASKKIRVNCVSPAQIADTEMTVKMLENFSDKSKADNLAMHPLGYGKTSDVANACIYLLSDASAWVTGTNLIVDGGYSAR